MKVHEVDVHPALPERLAWLGEIARNVWTSWHPEAAGPLRAPRSRGAGRLWRTTRWRCCGGCRRSALDAAAADESFVAMVARVARHLDAYANDPGWFPGAHPDAEGMRVAYFSLEFGLDAGIPLYSGGLGILAGDHLKSASDLGVPLVGVGLLYRKRLLPAVARPRRRPARALPGHRLVRPAARPTSPAPTAGRSSSRWRSAARPSAPRCGASRSGRVPLLLLDADIEGNPPEAREITSALYGGDREHAHPPGDPARRRRRAGAARRRASRRRSST